MACGERGQACATLDPVFDTILGLPAHPLFVHAAVVLLPLMALGTAAVAWRPDWWPRLAMPVAVLDFLVLVTTWVAKESGEKLEDRVDRTAAVHAHTELGEVLPLFAGVLFLCALIPAFLAWRARRTTVATTATTATTVPSRALSVGVAVVTTLVALGVAVMTFRVGHTGAEAVWGDLPVR